MQHEFLVIFADWHVQHLEIDGARLYEQDQRAQDGSAAWQYAEVLTTIACRLQEQAQRTGQDRLVEMVTPSAGAPFPFLSAQKLVLESLLGAAWFQQDVDKKTGHPAYQRWQLCEDMIERGLRLPEESHRLAELAVMILDNYYIVACTKGTLGEFSFGSLANYGDPKVQRRIRSAIHVHREFSSKLTELAYAAWHLSHSHTVTAYEEEGYPDFEVTVPGWDLPLAVDCKHIGRGTSERRIDKVIQAANKQIKALGKPCYGLAVLDVSEKAENSSALRDEVPQAVEDLRQLAYQALSAYNTSVSAALLVWNGLTVIEPSQVPGSLVLCLSRRTTIVPHMAPRHPIGEDSSLISFGTNTVMVALRVAPLANWKLVVSPLSPTSQD
jgi:hypothetical protein